ncbi:hypothetical protein TNCV_4366891 [Trichonephila clavipes]|nr:hypothetical protein TNCV_4366891 [Trichonephila clavipes]
MAYCPSFSRRSHALQRPNGMTFKHLCTIRLSNLPITRSEIHGRKEHGTFQTVERIVNKAEDKRVSLNRRKNANFNDDQGLDLV